MGLFRKNEADKKVDAAKVDLAAARAKLVAIDARDVEALANSATFAVWSTERTAAATEVDRLERLVAALVAGDAASKREAEEAPLRARRQAAEKFSAEVAARFRTEYPKLLRSLKSHARDMAVSQVETDRLNRILIERGDIGDLVDANNLARSQPAIPRQDITSKLLQLWVRASDGSLIGDQDAVVEAGDGKGHFIANRMRVDCVRREFKSVQYHPEIWSEIPEPFHVLLSLPNSDGQGAAFEGRWLVEDAVAGISLEPPKADKKARRPVQTEITPTAPWSPPVLKPVGAVDDAEK